MTPMFTGAIISFAVAAVCGLAAIQERKDFMRCFGFVRFGILARIDWRRTIDCTAVCCAGLCGRHNANPRVYVRGGRSAYVAIVDFSDVSQTVDC